MGKPVVCIAKPVPSDPEGDRLLAIIERKHGLTDYPAYLARITAQLNERRIGPGRYRKVAWPAGYKPKTRNPKAPAGRRWR